MVGKPLFSIGLPVRMWAGLAILWLAMSAAAAGYLVNGLAADLLNAPTLGWVFWPLMALPEAFAPRAEKRA